MGVFNPTVAIRTQWILANKVILKDNFHNPPRNIAGVDVAYIGEYGLGAAVLLDYEGLHTIDEKAALIKVDIPYIPTFLAFRELPPIIKALKRLRTKPDIIMVDAHGRMHPRRCGAASHLGVVLNIPTIGVAKSRLIGKETNNGVIIDKGEVIGIKLDRNVYVSIGHRISLETAVKIVSKTKIYKIPEPVRRAHNYAERVKKLIREGTIKIEDLL
ncbi:endonuclease V [Candidatus Geothermarchaeota archaeon]|nr:MAG: endonuclease V [Candidatus Geothermarchaeota archaeon]RLG61780.1 MAG: endonuclease V [Candidatus Geothermarchaeota archaeon]HEW94330.1 endonuclease V [Thermoprotei archaeon]